MIIKENYMGKINITENYLKSVISQTVSECFGVAGMSSRNFKEFVLSEVLRKKIFGKGVSVSVIENEVVVKLYISAAYGTNISTVVKSVKNKVYFVLEDKVGVSVKSVNVYIDNIKN